MKKIYGLIFILITICFLSSCNDNRVYKIKNVTWESDKYDIIVTSEQLYAQSYESNLTLDDYGTIIFDNEKYYCSLCLGNSFSLRIVNENELSYNHFLNGQNNFMDGFYKLEKVKNEKYQYKISIKLHDECGYYDYCVLNNIEFDEEIVLYGFENE